jgi:arylsulfatase A-like enzyme
MRAELSIYGSEHMHTPNFERLAAMGTVFERGYIAVSVCMPSRTALLSSRRPDTTRNYELNGATEYHRNVVNATTVPQWFKEHGYITYGIGKLFHYLPQEEIAYSFDPTSPSGYFNNTLSPKYININSQSPSGNLDSCIANATDDELSTGQMTVGTMNTLKYIVDSRENKTMGFEMDRPFFVGIGYHRPHEPYVAPMHYCDLYPDPDTTNSSFKLPAHTMPPKNMPDVAWSISGFVKGHPDIKAAYNITYDDPTLNAKCNDHDPATANVTLQLSKQCIVPLWKTARMRRAYWGAISYVDAMIGRLLDGLEEMKLMNSTVVRTGGLSDTAAQ